jgi:hypothetical protein
MTHNPNTISQQHEVDDLPLWRDEDAHQVLQKTLAQHGVDEEVFARLLSACRERAHQQRHRGITADFDEIFQSIGVEV